MFTHIRIYTWPLGKLMEEMAYVRKKGLEQEHVLSTEIINLQKE